MPTTNMITNPWRICRLGAMRPARRPLSQAPHDSRNRQNEEPEKLGGFEFQMFAKNAGADSTYRNMPLNGTPLASASKRNLGLEPSANTRASNAAR